VIPEVDEDQQFAEQVIAEGHYGSQEEEGFADSSSNENRHVIDRANSDVVEDNLDTLAVIDQGR